MKTTNVANNPGPASVIVMPGAKEIEVKCSIIMGEKDVELNPLQITDASIHTCEFDEEKKSANRRYDGKNHKADFEIMKEERDTRVKQGREVNKVVVKTVQEIDERV